MKTAILLPNCYHDKIINIGKWDDQITKYSQMFW